MIEALIRDDKRLICLVCIQAGPDKESLRCDIYIPSKGQTLSGVMPAGGEPAQQVARAVMTVYPVSALHPTTPEPGTESDRSDVEEKEEGPILELSRDMFPEVWELVSRRMSNLDKRDAVLRDREKKLEQDIESFRKSHPDRDK